MTAVERIKQAACVAEQMLEMITTQGEVNWSKGLHAIVCALRDPNDPDTRFGDAASIYTTMMGGAGSFSEFYLTNVEGGINQAFENLKSQLWDLLEASA